MKVRALYNDEIHIITNPDEDCEVSNISALDENGNIITVNDSMYLSPDADSVVTVDYAKTEHGETDPGQADGDDESGTIYNDEDENSQNNESGQNNSLWNPLTGDCISDLLALLFTSTIVIIFVI